MGLLIWSSFTYLFIFYEKATMNDQLVHKLVMKRFQIWISVSLLIKEEYKWVPKLTQKKRRKRTLTTTTTHYCYPNCNCRQRAVSQSKYPATKVRTDDQNLILTQISSTSTPSYCYPPILFHPNDFEKQLTAYTPKELLLSYPYLCFSESKATQLLRKTQLTLASLYNLYHISRNTLSTFPPPSSLHKMHQWGERHI